MNIKSIILSACAFVATLSLPAQESSNIVYTDASALTLVGRIHPGVPNMFNRVDVSKYPDLSAKDIELLKNSTGLALAFKTNSPSIDVLATTDEGVQISSLRWRSGLDLYIRKDGKWLWAGVSQVKDGAHVSIAADMDGSAHECLLYLPLTTHLASVKVGVAEGSTLEALPYPFGGGRIMIWGSSFTQGSGTTRPGLTYSAMIQRSTGLDILNAGMGGDCLMQPAVAKALCDADFDIFIIDAFSNGNPESMKKNFFGFIETVQSTHPGVPIIFQKTLYREKQNFNTEMAASEKAKAECADSLLNIALKKYKDIYVIQPNATSDTHDTTYDGTHPSEYGYRLWAESILPQLRPILKRYGIKIPKKL